MPIITRSRAAAALIRARSVRCNLTLLALLVAAPRLALAQAGGVPAGGTAAATDTAGKSAYGELVTPVPGDSVQLRIANRPIATFRAQVMGRSPAERAGAAAALITKILDRERNAAVDRQSIPDAEVIRLAGRPVFTITTWDVDAAAGETVADASAAAVENLRVAAAEYREQKSPRRIALGVLRVLLFSLGAYLLVRLIMAVRRRVIARVERWLRVQKDIDPRTAPKAALVAEGYLAVGLGRLIDLLALAATLAVGYVWLTGSLRSFPYTRLWGETLRSHLIAVVSSTLLAFVHAIPGLLAVGVIFLVTRYLTKLVNIVLSGVESQRLAIPWIDADIAAPTRRILNGLLWIFALLIAYPYLPGSGTDAFKGVSFFIGLIVSLGSSSVVNQAMSGLVLMYSRSLKPGDYVRIGATEGMVTHLGLLSTKVRTRLREEVSIPNTVVLSDTTKNYSRYRGHDGLMLSTTVLIGYRAPWRQVHALLTRAAVATPGLLREPAPLIRQTELGSFGVSYEVNARLENPGERIATLTRLHANIQDEFNQHGVPIMVPSYESDPEQPALVPPEKWHTAPAAPGGKGEP
jgi:small-conductance mechanosensitive channel